MPSPLVSAIIVSFNTRELTRRCLQTLLGEAAHGGVALETWVVDNASGDGSSRMVRDEFPGVHLLEPGENLGFGRANNLALEGAAGDFFLLLNSDAFVEAGALTALLEVAQANPRAGVVGPRLLNSDGSLQPSCWKFPSPARAWIENLGVAALFKTHAVLGDYQRWAHDAERAVEFLSGACLLVRRECYAEVGGFDPAFFLYAEETDWQKRMADAGWERVFTPAASVVHLGGASGENAAADAADRMRGNAHFWNGLDRFGLKHYGRGGLIALRGGMVVGSLARALTGALLLWGGARRGANGRKAARAHIRLHGWRARRQLTHPAPHARAPR